MKTAKVSITIDADLLEEIRAHAKGNLSRFVNAALRQQMRNVRLRQLVRAHEADGGAIPDELLAEAEAEFEAAEAAWQDD